MEKTSLRDLDVEGKRVLMRVDFNVPLKEDGSISDDTRIVEALPSIEYILSHGASLVLMSHLGKPGGKKNPKYTLEECAKRLSFLLKKPVQFINDCVGKSVEEKVASLKMGEILLLENLRFYPGEEEPKLDPLFAENLAKLGELYVNDAFGTAHRKHASTYDIAKYFPGLAATGLLLEKEISYLGSVLINPSRPFYAIIGGAKISSKIGTLKTLLSKVDALFIGGGMAYTFLKSQGISIGDSIYEEDHVNTALALLKEADSKGIKIFLPKDLVIANNFSQDAESKIILSTSGIPQGWQGLDIGPETIEEWSQELKKAKTIFWNGPCGVFEFPRFANGTNTLARVLSNLQATTIVGGGDSVSAIQGLNLGSKFTHLSTGGGASLKFLEYGNLPCIDILSNKN